MAQSRPVVDVAAEEQLRLNVIELMRIWRLNQAALAARLGQSQPWLSRRLSVNRDNKTHFQLEDLDRLSEVFGLSAAELLRPGYGQWDRRSGRDRRTGEDRRRAMAAPLPPTRELIVPRRAADNRLRLLVEPMGEDEERRD